MNEKLIEETKTWRLINENHDGILVKGPNWVVYGPVEPGGVWLVGEAFTPYAAWFNALLSAGFTKYMAHELAVARLGVHSEVPDEAILK